MAITDSDQLTPLEDLLNGIADALNTRLQVGQVVIRPSAANTPTSVSVTFPTVFPVAPTVIPTAGTTVPGTSVTGVSATGISTTGFTAWVTRTNTNPTAYNWVAVAP